MNTEYIVYFDFTTVHGNKFVGREGQLGIATNIPIEQIYNSDAISSLCAKFVYEQKPKWNIISLTVKNVTKLNSQQKAQVCDASKAKPGN